MADYTLVEGMTAPDFTVRDAEGSEVRLSDYRGRKVVLYFYPKDDTPGCTREAQGFCAAGDELAELGAVVLGLSKDGVASHARFRDKYALGFPLLSDPEHKVLEAYDAWREKKLYGKVSTGTERSTFLIDEQGVVRKVWRKVKVDGHVEAVLAALRGAAPASPSSPGSATAAARPAPGP